MEILNVGELNINDKNNNNNNKKIGFYIVITLKPKDVIKKIP